MLYEVSYNQIVPCEAANALTEYLSNFDKLVEQGRLAITYTDYFDEYQVDQINSAIFDGRVEFTLSEYDEIKAVLTYPGIPVVLTLSHNSLYFFTVIVSKAW